MDTVLEKLHLSQVNRPQNFTIGDTVRVHYKIREGNKERIQVYEGTVIAIQNEGAGRTFTVRRISYEVGVERIFPLYSPFIDKIEKMRSSRVRRSKLYYLREKIGKHGRLKEVKKKTPTDKTFEKAEKLKAEQEAARQKAEAENQKAEEQAPEAAASEEQPETPAE